MAVAIDGTVISGLGVASQTVKLQMPHLLKQFPAVQGCHYGTINISLVRALRIPNPDFTTTEIEWAPGNIEKFGFLGVDLEIPVGGSLQPSWIYIPYNSPHVNNFFQVEIMTAYIAGVSVNQVCRLHINKPHIEIVVV